MKFCLIEHRKSTKKHRLMTIIKETRHLYPVNQEALIYTKETIIHTKETLIEVRVLQYENQLTTDVYK